MTKKDLSVMKDVDFFPNDLVLIDNKILTRVDYVMLGGSKPEYHVDGFTGLYYADELTKVEE